MRLSMLLALMLSNAAMAEVYQCDGVYQDMPCEAGHGKAIKVNEQYVPDPTNFTITPHMDLERASRIRTARESSQIVRGMTPSDVRYSWGIPTQINKSMVGGKSYEQWVYRWNDRTTQYVYLEDGEVTSWN